MTPPPSDTAPHKKGGGMFGKLKSVAQNKTVQSVTKAALCSAVPGGQYVVAAADAKKNKTSVASSMVNSQSCIPGMPGAGMAGMGGKAGLAGAAVGAASMGGMGGRAGLAGAAAGASGSPSLAQIAAMNGMRGAPAGRGAAVTAMSIATLTSAMQQANAASAANGGAGTEMSTEAAGQQLKLSGAVAEEIRKGKLTIKKIDWVHGSPSVSAPMTQGFMDLMTTAGQAINAAGGAYRVDIYMDKKYSDAEIASLGQQRGAIIVASLQAGGQLPADVVTAGKIGKDKEQRVEIVKVK
ncbi:MAG: hypothetical protein ACM34L_09960 [Gemmatimonas sp.]|nr:hypothetical protein [Gemmatimonadaceae bacterium]